MGGSLKTLEGFREGTTQICLENEDKGGGEDRESHQTFLGGDHFSEVTFKQRGNRLNLTLFSPESSAAHPPPPLKAINNDRFLSSDR